MVKCDVQKSKGANILGRGSMYTFMKVFFKTNLFIYFSHLQTQQLKSY
jgi:hypothetical protein